MGFNLKTLKVKKRMKEFDSLQEKHVCEEEKEIKLEQIPKEGTKDFKKIYDSGNSKYSFKFSDIVSFQYGGIGSRFQLYRKHINLL
jgi:hypothetical protein